MHSINTTVLICFTPYNSSYVNFLHVDMNHMKLYNLVDAIYYIDNHANKKCGQSSETNLLLFLFLIYLFPLNLHTHQ